ncbi:LamG-like jellyroll fold domain-containing protein [Brachybacterium hainanense]|uniref:LamG-like jellyroll fold domain-containing protein n=1 Tax=Brachybacterium hainanense TaxID=1541174 RepID=A0ABV6R7J9_9MICO
MSRLPRTAAPSRSTLRRIPIALALAAAVGLTPALAAAGPLPRTAPVELPAGPTAPLERTPLPTPSVEAPAPDVLDVDVDASGLVEQTSTRTMTEFGAAPRIVEDPALGREVVSYDGTTATRYDFADGFTRTQEAVTLECTVRFDDGLGPGDDEGRGNFCGAKEGGGYSLTVYGSTLKMMVNVDGTYYGAGTEIRQGVWYHVTGTWDGETVALYLNGEKAAQTPTSGSSVKAPPSTAAHQFFLGADTNKSGDPQFHGTVSVAGAGIFSRALGAEEVTARYAQALADRTEDRPSFALAAPAEGGRLSAPTTLAGSIDHEELLASPLSFTLDGKPVGLGDPIGPGLAAGEHTIAWSGRDQLGEEIAGSAVFTSAELPVPGGIAQSSGRKTAHLTARATSPSGGDLRTTFREGDVSAARSAQQGVLDPTDLADDGSIAADVVLQEPQEVRDALAPGDGADQDSPVTAKIPALRADIPATGAGQEVRWSGQVDPARSVSLLLLDEETGRYEVVDTARGTSEGVTRLRATAAARHGSGGSIDTLVIGTDPFADDLDKPVEDGFEDPEDYDFSLMHITDTQYLSQGATQKKTPEERAEWASAYEESYRWAAENAEDRKIAYVAHTGDIIEDWNGGAKNRDRAETEMQFASRTQKILEDTGLVHSVLPGNHDNLAGDDTGSDSLYNEYFGPQRYETLAQQDSWKQAGAEYHPWKPGDNDNSYTIFTAGGQDFVALSLGYSVTQEETDWASGVLDQYAGRDAIILTHAYAKPSSSPDGRGAPFSQDGAIIHDQLLEKHPNVAMVLSGHEHGVSIGVRRDVGQKGNNVVELLADYQFYEVGSDQLGLAGVGGYDGDTGLRFGAAFFRLLQVDLDRGEVSVDTYSAYLDEFGATEYDTKHRYDGREDDFRLPVQFQGRSTAFSTESLLGLTPTDRVIGEVVHPSGEDAAVDWTGLKNKRVYGWFATTQDAAATDPREGIVQSGALTAYAKPLAPGKPDTAG